MGQAERQARAPCRPAPARRPPPRPATERRLVSVLFADLVGFTTLADDSDPEAVREFLGRYFDVAREVVERYGGAVEKFIGDAVMAVWGTPTVREDDAERAVRAALDLVAAVPGLAHPLVIGRWRAPGCSLARPRRLSARRARGWSRAISSTRPRDSRRGAARHRARRRGALRAAGEAIVFEAAGEQFLRGKTAPVPAWRAVRVIAGRRGAAGQPGRAAFRRPR